MADFNLPPIRKLLKAIPLFFLVALINLYTTTALLQVCRPTLPSRPCDYRQFCGDCSTGIGAFVPEMLRGLSHIADLWQQFCRFIQVKTRQRFDKHSVWQLLQTCRPSFTRFVRSNWLFFPPLGHIIWDINRPPRTHVHCNSSNIPCGVHWRSRFYWLLFQA